MEERERELLDVARSGKGKGEGERGRGSENRFVHSKRTA